MNRSDTVYRYQADTELKCRVGIRLDLIHFPVLCPDFMAVIVWKLIPITINYLLLISCIVHSFNIVGIILKGSIISA